ncbi:MAG: hypothetical protein Q4C89_05755 [Deinococcus sp.]|uniref:hypothetical protein n=1 Tax=Deinococcus sp. TaxID=47478 RepID=UPI0026DB96B3|nr:hypothetical protein [Deinococcus sp.]MDO4245507.1 hypothetical protein [Deinococcus sp.]
MSRVLLFVIGVLLLCVTALGALWLAGQVLVVLGALLTGAASVLLRLMLFLALAALVGGASYFVANAWRPGVTLAPAGVPAAPRPRRTSRWQRAKRGAAAPAASSPEAVSATPEQPTSLVVSAQPQVVQEEDAQVQDATQPHAPEATVNKPQ